MKTQKPLQRRRPTHAAVNRLASTADEQWELAELEARVLGLPAAMLKSYRAAGISTEQAIASMHFWDAFHSAGERVGTSPESRLRWLYDFAHVSPQPKRRNLTTFEVKAFCQFHGLSGDEVRALKADTLPFYSIVSEKPVAEVPELDDGTVERLRQQVRALWDCLRKPGTPYALSAPVIHGLFSQEASGFVRAFGYGGRTHEELFWANVVKLFMDVGRFRFCGWLECARAFMPSRPDKRFCSERCGGRERIARYRTSRGETSDERHGRYTRSVRKRLPNAKPARRKKGDAK